MKLGMLMKWRAVGWGLMKTMFTRTNQIGGFEPHTSFQLFLKRFSGCGCISSGSIFIATMKTDRQTLLLPHKLIVIFAGYDVFMSLWQSFRHCGELYVFFPNDKCIFVFYFALAPKQRSGNNYQEFINVGLPKTKADVNDSCTTSPLPTAQLTFPYSPHLVYWRNQTKNNCFTGSHLGRYTRWISALWERWNCLAGKCNCLFNALRHALGIYSDFRTDKFRLFEADKSQSLSLVRESGKSDLGTATGDGQIESTAPKRHFACERGRLHPWCRIAQ